jgi:hypothetical protein
MFRHNPAALGAQSLPVLELLERRFCFSTSIVIQSGIFADPTPFREPLEVQGLNTNLFVSGFNEEGEDGSALTFNPASGSAPANEPFTLGNLLFRNLPTHGGEAATVNLVLTLKVDEIAQTITVPLGIDNTWNTDDPVESRDWIFLDAGPIVGDVFEDALGQRMAVVILGFKTDGKSNVSEEFAAYEDSETSAQVIAGIIGEEMLDGEWLRSSDVPAWQAERQDWEDDFDDSSDFDDWSDDVIDDDGKDEEWDDMEDEAWDLDLDY